MQIYTETKSHRGSITNATYQSLIPTDVKRAVWKTPTKVSVVESTLLTGHPNHKTLDKRWYRWHTYSSMGFYRNAADNIVVYNCRRAPDGRRKTPFLHNNMNPPLDLLQNGTGDLADAFRDAMWETFRITSQEDFYPMMREYGLHSHQLVPTNLRGAFKAHNWTDYVTYAFGKTRASRLVGPVADTEPYVAAVAHQFRGLVDDDNLVRFVKKTKFNNEMMENFKPHAPLMREVLKNVTPESRKKILTSGMSYLDTLRIKVLSTQNPWAKYNRMKKDIEASTWEELTVALYGKRFEDPKTLQYGL